MLKSPKINSENTNNEQINAFFDEVYQYLKSKFVISEHTSPMFPLFHLVQQNILIHLIPIKPPCQIISDAAYLIGITEHFAKENVRVIHLWEDIWKRKSALVKHRLEALCSKLKTIHARQTEVKKISRKQAEDFFFEHHLFGSAKAHTYLALVKKDQIFSVASFSGRTKINRNGVEYNSYELIRFCNACGTVVVGGLSKLINHFANLFNPDDLMTYVDREWSNGASFEKLGFAFCGYTPPLKFWVHKYTYERIIASKAPFNEEAMREKGYEIITNCGNKKFIRFYK